MAFEELKVSNIEQNGVCINQVKKFKETWKKQVSHKLWLFFLLQPLTTLYIDRSVVLASHYSLPLSCVHLTALCFFTPRAYAGIVMSRRTQLPVPSELGLLAKHLFARPDFNLFFISNWSFSSLKNCFPAESHPPSVGFEFVKKYATWNCASFFYVCKTKRISWERATCRHLVSAEKVNISNIEDCLKKQSTLQLAIWFWIRCTDSSKPILQWK